jgi:2'-5' RNA ligase
MTQPKYSIWLMPSKADLAYLSTSIQLLARKYDAYTFEPHCTLFSPISDLKSSIKIIDAFDLQPFQVKSVCLNHSDVIWKTVFIELEMSDELEWLNQKFSDISVMDYEFKPHISLIYQSISSKKRQAIIDNLDLKKYYKMDGIAIMDTSQSVEEWKKVY